MEIREALIWTGRYNFMQDGNTNDSLTKVIKRFQSETKTPITGYLEFSQYEKLAADALDRRNAVGFHAVFDRKTGIRVGLPEKLITKTTDVTWGTSWADDKGELSIDIIKYADGTSLTDFYNRLKRVAGRIFKYDSVKSSSFVLFGDDRGGTEFFVEATAKDNQVRGFSVTFSRREANVISPIIMAMSASFEPFPESVQ